MSRVLIACSLMSILYYSTANVHDKRNTPFSSNVNCSSFCSSSICQKNAKFFIQNMDETVDPCDNFHQFVCGNYITRIVIPDDMVKIGPYQTAQAKLDQELIALVKTDILNSDLDAYKKMKIFYRNCLEEAKIEEIGKEPLLELTRKLGGWPVLSGNDWDEDGYIWEDVMLKISEEGFDPNFPITVGVSVDPTDSKNTILQIGPTKTIIDVAMDNETMNAHESYVTEIAVLLGADRERAVTEMKDMINFDIKLNEMKTLSYNVKDHWLVKNKTTISDLWKNYPGISWLNIMNKILSSSGVLVTGEEYINVYNPTSISKLGELLESTPKRLLANYQLWKVIESLVQYMPEEFRKIILILRQNTTGLKKFPRREKTCLYEMEETFAIAMSSLHAKKYFDERTKNEVRNMIQMIGEEMKTTLENATWMDDYTQTGALKKLDSMKALAGYSDFLFNDEKVENYYKNLIIRPGKFFDNAREISTYKKHFTLNMLGKPVAELNLMTESDMTKVNAFYSPSENKIKIMASILQEPVFQLKRPDYLNYGGLGYIIGHEIVHGFDHSCRYYDWEGNYKNWWSEATALEFQHKVACLVEKYSNYTIEQIDKKIDGRLTLGENIADLGGVKLAYRAYEKAIKKTKPTDLLLMKLAVCFLEEPKIIIIEKS